MPELPEVETIRRGLAPVLSGARLTRVTARRPDLRFPLPQRFTQRLTGARIEALNRRGKYLVAPLDTGETFLTHLGMTGRFTIGRTADEMQAGRFVRDAPPDPKHAHVSFETDAGATVTFYDPRRFGYMDLAPTAAIASCRWLRDLGPEPLGDEFNASRLGRAFAGRRQPVKCAMLDQRLIAGLGNIYVCEALYRARISPELAAGSIAPPSLRRLVRAVKEVLEDAIEAGGSTLKDYAQADGASGYFQHSFAVYGREGLPCTRRGCRGSIVRRVQSGRATFACALCQA